MFDLWNLSWGRKFVNIRLKKCWYPVPGFRWFFTPPNPVYVCCLQNFGCELRFHWFMCKSWVRACEPANSVIVKCRGLLYLSFCNSQAFWKQAMFLKNYILWRFGNSANKQTENSGKVPSQKNPFPFQFWGYAFSIFGALVNILWAILKGK